LFRHVEYAGHPLRFLFPGRLGFHHQALGRKRGWAVDFVFRRWHPGRVMDHVILHVLPHKQSIAERNVKFFLENQGIFAGLPEDRIRYYSNIISGGERLDDEDRQTIWEYFDTIVGLAEICRKLP